MDDVTVTPLVPSQLDAIVFDVIGTLVDESGAWAKVSQLVAAEAGLAAPAEFHKRWEALLEMRMNSVISGEEPWRPHSQLVSSSASEAISALGGHPSPATSALAEFVDRQYVAWPEVAQATAALRRYRLVAGVSNGDIDSLARLSNANAISWDVALSTGAVRTFKPAPPPTATR
jgi:2-haloacid dehalogenase